VVGGEAGHLRTVDLERVGGWVVVRSHGGPDLARGSLRNADGGELVILRRWISRG